MKSNTGDFLENNICFSDITVPLKIVILTVITRVCLGNTSDCIQELKLFTILVSSLYIKPDQYIGKIFLNRGQ